MRSGGINPFCDFSPASHSLGDGWWPNRLGSIRGTVLLVSLCFVTVMGIALGSYLAVCSRAMNLSNRSLQAGLSKQLAEAGLEEALRAFNRNDWSDWSSAGTTADWTLDTTNKRATATISHPATKFGQGVTATVKLRVDNYDSTRLGYAWNSAKNYRVGEIVGYNGIWYTCIKNHSNQTPPNWNFWVPESAPVLWDATSSYEVSDLIVHNEVWYRCTANNTNLPPATNPGSWTALAGIYTSAPPWPYVPMGQEALLFSGGNVVRLTNASWPAPSPPHYAWRWREGVNYQLNDVVHSAGVWYRCISSHTSNWWPDFLPTPTRWIALTDMWAWSAFASYSMGDVVYHSGTGRWYRCTAANINQTPSTTSAFWADTPLLSLNWNSSSQYSANDVVSYNGVWYLSLLGSNTGQNPSTQSAYWAGADTPSAAYQWNATTPYAAGAYRCYGGVWYRCLAANTGQSPNNPTYWTAAWAQSSGVTTGAPVVYAEAIVTLGDGTTSRTQLRAPVVPAPLFPNAAGAETLISMPASSVVDSYDSSLGTYNQTSAPFSGASPNRGSAAVLAAGRTGGTAVSVTSARINGYVAAPPAATNPFAPLFSYGGTAILTDVASPTTPNPRVNLARVSSSPVIPKFDIQTIAGGTAISLPSGIVHLGTPGATTPSVYQISGNLDRTGAGDILRIVGPVVINVTGRLYITAGRIIIASTGSLHIRFGGQLYVGQSTTTGIQNLTLDPQKCVLIGTSTANSAGSHYYWSTDPFYGVIYMPEAYLSTWNNVKLYGAISARNIAFPNAGCDLHYDTSLRHATFGGVDQPYTVSSWRELPATEQATMP